MLYIASALYEEVRPLIEKMQLKKEAGVRGLQLFSNEKLKCAVCGTGQLNAASSIGTLLEKEQAGNGDILLWYGCAAGLKPGMYQAESITDTITHRTYYPDLLLETVLPLTGFFSGYQLYEQQDAQMDETHGIYEMECAGAVAAAGKVMGPHQLFFVRFVSDDGHGKITLQVLHDLSLQYAPMLEALIEKLLAYQELISENTETDHEEIINALAEKLHATSTMRAKIAQLLRYGHAAGIDTDRFVKKVLSAEVRDKEQGKQVLHELERDIVTAKVH
ncbi:MAG: hypothetical protein SOI44_05205 [Lactimicrobium sp.]|jgi:hypothetical protein|uniref:hypothetical protein n=1 Tax=Lactimicrobium sp. TaxID=2563780 RepID=UPI002F351485